MAYCRLAGVEWPDDLHALAGGARYVHTFVLETLVPVRPRLESGRLDTPEESRLVGRMLEEIYRPRSAALTRLGPGSIAERTARILAALGFPGPADRASGEPPAP
jgi:hypothetical protein